MPSYTRGRSRAGRKHTKTQRRHTSSSQARLISSLLDFQTYLKLFHWHTGSYASHKASDTLHTDLSANIDSFVEKMLGKYASIRSRQIPLEHVKIHLTNPKLSQNKMESRVVELKKQLMDMRFSPKNSDLANIRDEMLGQLNQFMYLEKLR